MEQLNHEQPKFKHHGLKMIFMIIVLACLSLFLLVEVRNSLKEYDYIGKSEEIPNTISITGEGSISSVADIAKISVGVRTEGATVELAQNTNTEQMNQVIEAIKKQGVEEKDLKTKDYSVYPKYEYKDGVSDIVGYNVSQNLDVKIREPKNVSQVLRVAAEKGANQIGSLSFEIDNPEKLKEQAREMAITQAQEKAKVLAEQLDVKLGQVVSFSEYADNGDGNQPKYYAAEMGGAGVDAPSIESGENEVKINVTITYEIL